MKIKSPLFLVIFAFLFINQTTIAAIATTQPPAPRKIIVVDPTDTRLGQVIDGWSHHIEGDSLGVPNGVFFSVWWQGALLNCTNFVFLLENYTTTMMSLKDILIQASLKISGFNGSFKLKTEFHDGTSNQFPNGALAGQTWDSILIKDERINITTTQNPANGGTSIGAGKYAVGASVTVTATPATGWNFTDWTENGTQVSTSASYTFTASANRNLVANFTQSPPQQVTITTSSNPTNGGTTTGGGNYNVGASVTVTATPTTGWNFTNWTENGTQVSTSASYTFTASASRNLVANFSQSPPQQVTITTSSNPNNGGTTTGGGTYNVGSSVTVVATPATGWYFVNWTESGVQVSVLESYTFTATENRSLVANFTQNQPQQVTITTSSNPTNGGTTTGGGNYNVGASVTVTATPTTGWNFTDWTENGTQVSTSASYTFTASANRNLVANFSQSPPQQVTITTSSNPTNGGTTTGGGNYNVGASVTVTATPATGWNFTDWTENGTQVSTSASYTFTASANRNLVANFTQSPPQQVTITTSSNPTNGGTTSGGGTYNVGASVTVVATPATGWYFVNWTESGVQVSVLESYTFTATENRSLVANFTQNQPQQVTISTTSNPENGGTTSGTGTYNVGASVTVVATPASGWNFTDWTENGTQVSTSASYTFTASVNRDLVANFTENAPQNVTITTSSNPSNGGTTTGDGTYATGSQVTVVATPATAYTFVNWTENGTQVSTSASYMFTATASRNLVANFTQSAVTYTVTFSVLQGMGTLTAKVDGTQINSGDLVDAGKVVVFTATPASNWFIKKWVRNGDTLPQTASTLSFQVNTNLEVGVLFGSYEAIEPIVTDEVKIFQQGNFLIIEGIKPNQNVEIYSVAGVLLYRAKVSESIRIPLNIPPQVVIVHYGTPIMTRKVFIR